MKKYSNVILAGLIIIIVFLALWGRQQWLENQELTEQLSDSVHKNRQYELKNDELNHELEYYAYLEEDFKEAQSDLNVMTRKYNEATEEGESYQEIIKKGGMVLGTWGQYFFDDFPDFDYGEITSDLREHPEMIGIHAVLGGTMQFDEIHLLSDRLVYASFSDGHIVGDGIYSYTIGHEGNWQWQRMIEYPDSWNPNLRYYIAEGRLPTIAEINDDQVSVSTTLEELLSHYTETVDGAYAENYAYMLYDFYRYTPADIYLTTLFEAGPITKAGAMALLSYEVISMGEQDGMGVEYLISVLEEMGINGELDQTFVDNFLEILASTQKNAGK